MDIIHVPRIDFLRDVPIDIIELVEVEDRGSEYETL